MKYIVLCMLFVLIVGCSPCTDVSSSDKDLVIQTMRENGYLNIGLEYLCCKRKNSIAFRYSAEREEGKGILFTGRVSCKLPIERCSIEGEEKAKLIKKKSSNEEI